MDSSNERRRRERRARERAKQREARRQALRSAGDRFLSIFGGLKLPRSVGKSLSAATTVIGDALWYLRKQKISAVVWKVGAGVAALAVIVTVLSLVLSSDISPGIRSLGVPLGGQSVEAATEQLADHWENELTIRVLLNGQTLATVEPEEIGLQLDAAATAQAAKDAGLAGLPFGYDLEPVLDTSYGDAQTYMLSIGQDVFIPAYEAGYVWENGAIVGNPGTPSRELDVPLSVQRIMDNPLNIIQTRRLDLVTTSTPPSVVDPSPYLDMAQSFVDSNFSLTGYDPFTNDQQRWATTREEMARWLVATNSGLRIRENAIENFISTINANLDTQDWPRYLDSTEARDAIETAFLQEEATATVRIRYAGTTYSLASGDWGYRLSRRTGLPFGNIDQANPGVDWNATVVGQRINLPSRDLVMPLEPVLNKRIVVDLERLWLVAYENDQPIFHWPISTGRASAPTSPGVFQILEKIEVAYGSSFALCNESGECGQWEMNYFMSIYDVGGGLLNGFHGAVLLPNGAYLDGGSNQIASTYGCVMSDDEQARILFEWAEVGTVVEMVSSEYPPQSDIGRDAMTYITQVSGQS